MTTKCSVWVDKYVSGWDGQEGQEPQAHPTLPVVEALSTLYDTDAHFVPYRLQTLDGKDFDACPRIRNEAMPHLADYGVKIVWDVAVADIDHEDTHAGRMTEPSQEWRDTVWAQAQSACPDALLYQTRGGMRVIVALPHTMEQAEYLSWCKTFRAYLRSWCQGSRVDEIVSALQCYRLAYVVRDGRRESRKTLIREPAVMHLPSVLELDDTGAIAGEKKPFKLPRRIEEGTRHQTLVRYAAQLRWQGLSIEEISQQLADVNAQRCRPPYDDAKLAEIARWAGAQATRPDLAPARAPVEPAQQEEGQEEEPFELGDHTEIAQRVAVRLGKHSSQKLVADRGEIYRYADDQGIWDLLPQHVLEAEVHHYSGHPVRVFQPNGRQVLRPLKINDSTVVGVVKSLHRLLAKPGFFDAAKNGLTFTDCWVSITKDGVQRHIHSPDQRSRVSYPFPYTDARPVKFLNMLNDYWGEQENTEDFVRLYGEFVGASLCGIAPQYQLAIVFLGEGSNGKSTLVLVTVGLFPKTVVTNVSPQDFGKDSSRAMLSNAYLNVVGELPERRIDQLSIAALKAMISGDEITARWLYKNPFSFKPKAGHLLTANRMPDVEDDSDGTFRRIAILTFRRKFEAPNAGDRKLHDVVLEEERDRIVCWALRQTPDLIRRGHFVQPKESIDEVTAWRTGQDEISLFLHDRTTPCEAIRGQGTDADSLYQAYYAWAPVNGYKVRNKNSFLSAIDKRRKKFYDNNIQRRMYPVNLKSVG